MSDTETVEIVKTPGTLSGKPRIKGKRIGVLMLGDMIPAASGRTTRSSTAST